MRVGLDSYSYHLAFGRHGYPSQKPMDLFQFMEKAKQFGLAGVHIDPGHLQSIEEDYLLKVKKFAQERNLYIEAGAVGCEPHSLKKMLNSAHILGSKVLRTFVGAQRYKDDFQQQIKSAVEGLKIACKEAERLGIIICLENHQDLTSLEMLQVIAQVGSPYLGICLDTGNSLAVLEEPLQAVRNLAPLAYTTHFKDYDIVPTDYGAKIVGCPLGEGILPLKEIWEIIRKEAPQPNINLEIAVEAKGTPEEALAFEEECIAKSVAYVKENFRV